MTAQEANSREVGRTIMLRHAGASSLAGTVQSFPRPVVRLGRAPNNDAAYDPVRDRVVSAWHAEVRNEDDGLLRIVDLGSRNGTVGNGRRLEPWRPVPITPDDEIALGGARGPSLRAALVRQVPREGP
jgi:pSer/pThr/pTyr-binding forkhead associated (FHA) protein